MELTTEHHTHIEVGHFDSPWANVHINDPQCVDDYAVFSFTPAEARLLANALLNAADAADMCVPHHNS